MVNNIKTQNDKLLKVIDQLFVFSVDTATGNKKVLINPLLNDEKLKVITKDTRDIILDLYTGCESNFIEGLKIYEAIIRNQQFETTKSQIDNLKIAVGQKLPELGDDLNRLSTSKDDNTLEEEEEESDKTPPQEDESDKTPPQEGESDKTPPQEGESDKTLKQEDQSNKTPPQEDQSDKPQEQEDKDLSKENQSGILENMLNTIKNTVTQDKKVEEEIDTLKSIKRNESISNTSLQDTVINKTEPTLTDKIETYKTQKMNEAELHDQSS